MRIMFGEMPCEIGLHHIREEFGLLSVMGQMKWLIVV